MGKLIVHNYEDFMAALSKMWRDPPKKYPVELEVNEIKTRRNSGQNRLFHDWLPSIAEALSARPDDYGKFHIFTKEYMKTSLVFGFTGCLSFNPHIITVLLYYLYPEFHTLSYCRHQPAN